MTEQNTSWTCYKKLQFTTNVTFLCISNNEERKKRKKKSRGNYYIHAPRIIRIIITYRHVHINGEKVKISSVVNINTPYIFPFYTIISSFDFTTSFFNRECWTCFFRLWLKDVPFIIVLLYLFLVCEHGRMHIEWKRTPCMYCT